MYDENANVSNGASTTLTVVANGTESPPTAPVYVQLRPNPSSPASSDASCAYYSCSVGPNWYRPNGQVNQQLNRMHLISHVMNVKDPTWLLVEVCREFQRGQCSRNEQECKFAHPPSHVEIQNGRVITCYDNLKNRCNRGTASCKFLHPPQHLKDQVLINGRNNYAWKNLLAAQVSQSPNFAAPVVTNMAMGGPFGATVSPNTAPLMPAGVPTYNPYSPYAVNTTAVYPNVVLTPHADAYGNVGGVLTTAVSAPNAMPMFVAENDQKMVNLRMDRPDLDQDAANKRAAMGKVGIPVFQPVASAMNGGTTLHCAPLLPAFPPFHTSYVPVTFTGPPSIPRL